MKTNIPTRQLPLGAGHGAPLPYDALCEYVENTGAQYVDTGVPANIASQTMSMRLRLLGSGTGAIGYINSGVRWRYTINSYGTGTASLTYTRSPGTAISTAEIDTSGEIVLSSDDTYLYVTGLAPKRVGVCSSVLSLPLFGYRAHSTTDTSIRPSPVRMRLYAWTAGVDASTRDLAPCRVGTAGALYDRVSGELFYSATSTALIPGPDLP